ncbi:hypothetical protein [Parachlamydia sp. AcF125]|uniref:hypothetical protein n=1 Tax=Parachlamydia sp. AcF125 TaxID=2795736 RepID=UPI001BCA11A0|nr:hypothetical protein [Parachlamydia sp. AcF125]MBS4168103.1 hypothetical protein [Parachlamydia sp. AcF125]
MQCSTTNDLSNGIHDVYIAGIKSKLNSKIGQQEMKISLISTRAFSDMELTSYETTLPDRAYVPSLHTQVKYSTSFTRYTWGIEKIRNILTTSYAKLDVKNGASSLTISPLYTNQFKEHLPIKIVYYRDQKTFEKKEDKIELGAMQIYAFAEEEFKYEYIQAAHRIQSNDRRVVCAIFKQTKKPTSLLGKIKKALESEGEYTEYKPGQPYDIEKELVFNKSKPQRKLLGYSIAPSKQTSSDASFVSALSSSRSMSSSDEEFQSASAPSLASLSLSSPESSPSSQLSNHREFAVNQPHAAKISEKLTYKRGPIEDYNEMVDEIDRILAKKGLNRESNSLAGCRKFTLSMHFKSSSRDPAAILLTTWLSEASEAGKPSIPFYGIPMNVEISFDDGSSESFEYILRTWIRIPLSAPKWEGCFAEMPVPRTCEEARKNAEYEAYLDGLAMRILFKKVMHEGSSIAKRKFNTIYCNHGFWTNIVPHISYESKDFKKRWSSYYLSLKKRDVKSIGIGDRDKDPDLVVFDFTKKINGKAMNRLAKNKLLKFEVDNPFFAP